MKLDVKYIIEVEEPKESKSFGMITYNVCAIYKNPFSRVQTITYNFSGIDNKKENDFNQDLESAKADANKKYEELKALIVKSPSNTKMLKDAIKYFFLNLGKKR